MKVGDVQRSTRMLAIGLALAGGLFCVLVSRLGDYPADAGPAIAALAHGSFRRAAAVPFLMGPLTIVLRAPFARAADMFGQDGQAAYRAGIVPCLIAGGALGAALASRRTSGRREAWLPFAAALVLLSPASVAAVQTGHPEEMVGGALGVAAVLLAARGRPGWAGLALGLAIATKQWALLAIVPTLLAAAPGQRRRVAGVAAVTAAAFYLPFVAGDPHAFLQATRIEAHVVHVAAPQSIWLPFARTEHVQLSGFPVLTYHALAAWVPTVSHALIVLLPIPLAALWWRRRLDADRALALLALLFLIRCALDPVDQDYFHLPFVLALLAFEAMSERFRLVRGLPVATLAVFGCLWLSFDGLSAAAHPWLVATVYLAWTSAAAAYLVCASANVRVPWKASTSPTPSTGSTRRFAGSRSRSALQPRKPSPTPSKSTRSASTT
jgi:Glycosyltransferase family 87